MFDNSAPLTPGFVAIDNDQIDLYRNVKLPTWWSFDITSRCQYVLKHNNIFKRYPGFNWYGSLSDDMVPITQNWDIKLVASAGRRGIAYANDLYTRRCGAFVIGGDLVRAMGFIFPSVFKHYYGDTTLELICREFALAGLQENIIIEHRHYGNKKNPGKFDETSKGRPSLKDERKVWDEWLSSGWPDVRKKLQTIISTT